MTIDTAFLVCAGLGTRMKPLTETCPKPLLPLHAKPLLSHIFDHLRVAGVTHVTVNTHHLPLHLTSFLKTVSGFHITESYEADLLETGGGLIKALPSLGDKPFFMINGDAFWIDKGQPILHSLAQHFDAHKMDILVCLIAIERMTLTEGVGDYDLLPDGKIIRNLSKQGTHMFTGIRVVNPSAAYGYPENKFSFLKMMDAAQEKGRLYGFVMEGDWHHISTPEDLDAVEKSFNLK